MTKGKKNNLPTILIKKKNSGLYPKADTWTQK